MPNPYKRRLAHIENKVNDLHEQATHIHTLNCQLMDDFTELKEEIEEFNANHKRPAASGENENGQANGKERLRTSGLGGCVLN